MRSVIAVVLGAGCASAGGDQPIDAGGRPTDAARIDAPVDAANLCPGPDTCTGVMRLGSVSGDTGAQKLSAMGYRAAWVRVRVTEDDSSISGQKVSVTVKLTSPAGVAFQPLVYVDTLNDVVDCTMMFGTPTTNGNVRQVRAEWGEGSIANGADESRDVSIEIRPPASGGCAPGMTWQLEIEGNT